MRCLAVFGVEWIVLGRGVDGLGDLGELDGLGWLDGLGALD